MKLHSFKVIKGTFLVDANRETELNKIETKRTKLNQSKVRRHN